MTGAGDKVFTASSPIVAIRVFVVVSRVYFSKVESAASLTVYV